MRPHEKKSIEVWRTQKVGKERENSYRKNEKISRWKAHTYPLRKVNWNFFTITDVFLNQKRVNVYEHKVKTAPSLRCVHIHWLSSDRERHLWSLKYFKKASVCLCVPFIWRSLNFLVKISSFFSYFFKFVNNSVMKIWAWFYFIHEAFCLFDSLYSLKNSASRDVVRQLAKASAYLSERDVRKGLIEYLDITDGTGKQMVKEINKLRDIVKLQTAKRQPVILLLDEVMSCNMHLYFQVLIYYSVRKVSDILFYFILFIFLQKPSGFQSRGLAWGDLEP